MGVFGILRSCVFRRIMFASLSSCFIVSCVLEFEFLRFCSLVFEPFG